jgi:hypothetical protein
MANIEYLKIIKQGVDAWNEWRKNNPNVKPDLSRVVLMKTNLQGADLRNVILSYSDLWASDLRNADLKNAILNHADLNEANLSNADLRNANLFMAQLDKADFTNANLGSAVMMGAILVGTNLSKANLSNCKVFGISVWNVKLTEAIQKNLIISPEGAPIITVDNLEVAQFIYLLLHNEKIRHVIDTITTKVVLILGRFTPKRKAVLNAIRDELRKHDYIPVLFDFEKPSTKDTQETVTTLARLAKFVIADITSPKSIPQELASIVETLPSLPVKPLLKEGSKPWDMFDHIKRYPWVLTIHHYRDLEDLMATLKEKVIDPSEAKVLEIRNK